MRGYDGRDDEVVFQYMTDRLHAFLLAHGVRPEHVPRPVHLVLRDGRVSFQRYALTRWGALRRRRGQPYTETFESVLMWPLPAKRSK